MRSHLKWSFTFIAAIVLLAVGFTGCQTADGLGQDLENLGKSIQE
jgi:predicted small secreted protein